MSSAMVTGHRIEPHEQDCLAASAREALCRCARGDWFDELVPRAQARRELLDQLATWAGEQRALADAEIRGQDAPLSGRPGWAQQGVRAAATMASEVYVGVRRTALAMREECERPAPAVAVTVSAIEAEDDAVALDENAVATLATTGGYL